MLLLRKMCDKYSSLQILHKFVCYFYAKCVINIQAYKYCINLCATSTQMCDKYSSLHILRKFVCYFYAKYVINIQAKFATCVLLLRKMCGSRSFGAKKAILKNLRSFVANWLLLRFTRFLRKILGSKTAVA